MYVANAPELTVVRDLDGDDEADEYVLIYTDLGNREHALHGLNWAPDGKLYMSKGNSTGHNQPEKYGYVAPRPFRELWDVVHPPGAPDSYPPKTYTKHSYRKTYHHWSDDWGREGGTLRCGPLGTQLEIVARGLRNPWDMTMDDGFNFLGTDNDQDQGDRIFMPFYGAHFGWGHSYSSHWTGANHLPTAPISGPVFPGSGTGIIFYAHEHFPPEYRGVFFINDWLHGTYVYRPTWDGALLQPEGGRWQPFASKGEGEMFYRPTDLEFGPDGSVYICGWGRDYHYDPAGEGSWMFRVSYTENSATPVGKEVSDKRSRTYADWNVDDLMEDLGADVLPVWRVNAQEELVRRGASIRDVLIRALSTAQLNQSQETWVVWALGRMTPADPVIEGYLTGLANPIESGPVERGQTETATRQMPLNLRLQALRILAHQVRNHTLVKLPDAVAASLADPEPRIRFEAVQAIWQVRGTQHLPRLVDRLATETDRLVFYAGWRALRELADVPFRRQLLEDRRPAVRLAALLGLLEGHEVHLDEVLALAERETDERIQNWALTWAMNPQPPKAMPNKQVRIVLEESVSMRSLMERADKAKGTKLRKLYLTMISRATYGDEDNDWEEVRDFYRTLESDDERSLVVPPLAREDGARRLLWDALGGSEALRQAAIRGFVSLSHRAGNSAEKVAGFLLSEMARESSAPRGAGAVEALSRLRLPDGWRPAEGWDATLSQAFEKAEDPGLRGRILTILLAIDAGHVAQGIATKKTLEKASTAPHPRLYASLTALHPRLGIRLEMKPPEKATVAAVLARLATADPARGRALFYSATGSTACSTCHRIAGKGNNFAPELSGIGLRSPTEKIIEAVLEPSATITEGFQLQTFVLTDGTVVSGAVLRESSAEIRLVTIDGRQETIATPSVATRSKTKLSAMPSGFALLGNEAVADVAAFLTTCRHGSVAK